MTTTIDAIVSANSDAPAPASGARPYWQTEPCPTWCKEGSHEDTAYPEDRAHMSISQSVTLTLEAPDITRSRDGSREVLEFFPGTLTAYLDQRWREREARVVLSHNEATGIELTLAEAGNWHRH